MYDNGNHSNDPKLAHGFNYHQGPEWLWPIGYFLRAELFYFSQSLEERKQTLRLVKKHLGKLNERLNSNDWKSLPELTNRNGEECYFSCPAQAWSVATTLEVFFDLATCNQDSL
jgi:glycogen debranching enzyme